MQIKFKSINSDKVHVLKFKSNYEYVEFYTQMTKALTDPTNTQTAIYKSDGDDRIFPALFLKNCYIIASESETEVDSKNRQEGWV